MFDEVNYLSAKELFLYRGRFVLDCKFPEKSFEQINSPEANPGEGGGGVFEAPLNV